MPEEKNTVYQELCKSYLAIDDFRTKLLGILPLATASGLLLLLTDEAKIAAARPFLCPIGILGFVITLGLFFFELYGIKKCTCLIWAGQDLEEKLDDTKGQFRKRPSGVAGFINEPIASGIIYPAVMASWMFLAFAFPLSPATTDSQTAATSQSQSFAQVQLQPCPQSPSQPCAQLQFQPIPQAKSPASKPKDSPQIAFTAAIITFFAGFSVSLFYNLKLMVEGELRSNNPRPVLKKLSEILWLKRFFIEPNRATQPEGEGNNV